MHVVLLLELLRTSSFLFGLSCVIDGQPLLKYQCHYFRFIMTATHLSLPEFPVCEFASKQKTSLFMSG